MNILIDGKKDDSFKMNMDYFNYCAGFTMTNSKFHRTFSGSLRKPESKLTQKEMDLSRSVYEVNEEIIMKMAKDFRKEIYVFLERSRIYLLFLAIQSKYITNS